MGISASYINKFLDKVENTVKQILATTEHVIQATTELNERIHAQKLIITQQQQATAQIKTAINDITIVINEL